MDVRNLTDRGLDPTRQEVIRRAQLGLPPEVSANNPNNVHTGAPPTRVPAQPGSTAGMPQGTRPALPPGLAAGGPAVQSVEPAPASARPARVMTPADIQAAEQRLLQTRGYSPGAYSAAARASVPLDVNAAEARLTAARGYAPGAYANNGPYVQAQVGPPQPAGLSAGSPAAATTAAPAAATPAPAAPAAQPVDAAGSIKTPQAGPSTASTGTTTSTTGAAPATGQAQAAKPGFVDRALEKVGLQRTGSAAAAGKTAAGTAGAAGTAAETAYERGLRYGRNARAMGATAARGAVYTAPLAGFGDYRIVGDDIDSSAGGTVGYLANGDFGKMRQSLAKAAVEAGLDSVGGIAKTVDSVAGLVGANPGLAQGFDNWVQGKLGDQVITPSAAPFNSASDKARLLPANTAATVPVVAKPPVTGGIDDATKKGGATTGPQTVGTGPTAENPNRFVRNVNEIPLDGGGFIGKFAAPRNQAERSAMDTAVLNAFMRDDRAKELAARQSLQAGSPGNGGMASYANLWRQAQQMIPDVNPGSVNIGGYDISGAFNGRRQRLRAELFNSMVNAEGNRMGKQFDRDIKLSDAKAKRAEDADKVLRSLATTTQKDQNGKEYESVDNAIISDFTKGLYARDKALRDKYGIGADDILRDPEMVRRAFADYQRTTLRTRKALSNVTEGSVFRADPENIGDVAHVAIRPSKLTDAITNGNMVGADGQKLPTHNSVGVLRSAWDKINPVAHPDDDLSVEVTTTQGHRKLVKYRDFVGNDAELANYIRELDILNKAK